MKMSKQSNIIAGFIALLCGLGVGGFAVYTYMEDTAGWLSKYTYAPPFTNHEITVIECAFLGAFLLICAIILLVRGFMQEK